MKNLIFYFVFCSFLFAGGCATSDPNIIAGKSLLSVKSVIVSSASAADTLCKSGAISQKNCLEIKGYYEESKVAYDAAVDAYLLMIQGGDPNAFSASIERVNSIANAMIKLSGEKSK